MIVIMTLTDKQLLGQAKGLLTHLQKQTTDSFSAFVLTGQLKDGLFSFNGDAFGDDYLQYRAFLEFFLQSPQLARLMALALMRYETVSEDFSFEDMNGYTDAIVLLTELSDALVRGVAERETYCRAVTAVFGDKGFDDEAVKKRLALKDTYLDTLKETYGRLEKEMVRSVVKAGDAE